MASIRFLQLVSCVLVGLQLCNGTITTSCAQDASQRVACSASTAVKCKNVGCWWCGTGVTPSCTEGAACRRTIVRDCWKKYPQKPKAATCRKEYGCSWCKDAPVVKCREDFVTDDTLTCTQPHPKKEFCDASNGFDCLNIGCWWCTKDDEPRCTRGIECKRPNKKTCWPSTDSKQPNAADCRNKYGCSWCPNAKVKCVKEYVEPSPGLEQCDVARSQRTKCPVTGRNNEKSCTNAGCWWCGDDGIFPNCIYGKACSIDRKVQCWPENNPSEPNPADCRLKYGCSWCPDVDNTGAPECVAESDECDRLMIDRQSCPYNAGQKKNGFQCRKNGCFWCSGVHPRCTRGKACQEYPKVNCWPASDSGEPESNKCWKTYGCSWCDEDGEEPRCVKAQALCEFKDSINCYPWSDPKITKEQCLKDTDCVYCPVPSTREFKCVRAICPDGHILRYKQRSCCKGNEPSAIALQQTGWERIIGGVPAIPGQWPWQVSYRIMGAHACGAVLLDSKHVVTAAHCIIVAVPAMSLLFGSTKATADEFVISDGLSVTLHPDYNSVKFDHDLALISFPEITFTASIAPIDLPYGEVVPVGARCFVTGWGTTDPRVDSAVEDLLEVGVHILPFEKCKEPYDILYSDVVTMDENLQICAGAARGGKDSCSGDSGGPLVCQRCSSCDWYLAGTVAFAYGCALYRFPGVYMRMTAYDQFLYDNGVVNAGKSHDCDGFY